MSYEETDVRVNFEMNLKYLFTLKVTLREGEMETEKESKYH